MISNADVQALAYCLKAINVGELGGKSSSDEARLKVRTIGEVIHALYGLQGLDRVYQACGHDEEGNVNRLGIVMDKDWDGIGSWLA